MKTVESRRESDYLLLYAILGKYLEKGGLQDRALAPRYTKLETIEDIVEPFRAVKYLIQRVEWLMDKEYVDDIIAFQASRGLSDEELMWAVDMFAVKKQDVMNQINKGKRI